MAESPYRRRHCTSCGKWLECGDDDTCKRCDPECWGCHERESECGALDDDNLCLECVEFDRHERERVPDVKEEHGNS